MNVFYVSGLAYCLLASLPPWYGLFSAFFPVVLYFFLGTSRHISVGKAAMRVCVGGGYRRHRCSLKAKTLLIYSFSLFEGPFPVLCLMIGSVVTRLVPDEGLPHNITGFEGLTRDEQRVLVASSVTFLAGIMQVKHTLSASESSFQPSMCFFTSNHIISTTSLSPPASDGYPAGGVCCHVPVRHPGVWLHHGGRRPHLGVPAQVCVGADCPRPQRSPRAHICECGAARFIAVNRIPLLSAKLFVFQTLEIIFNKITSTNVCDVVISLTIMVVVFVVKELNDRFKSKLPVPIPIEVIMVSFTGPPYPPMYFYWPEECCL